MAGVNEFLSWRLRQAIALSAQALPYRPPREVRSVLCILEGGLGDRLMALPAVRTLKSSYTEASVTVALSGPVPFLEQEFDCVVDWSSLGIRAKLRLVRRRFDVCFVNSIGVYDPWNELLAIASGAWLRLGPRYPHVRQTGYTDPYAFGTGMHETIVNARGAGWRGTEEALEYPLPLTRKVRESVATDLPILLHPGCRDGYNHKRWPPEHYRELARLLAQSWGPGVVVIGAPAEEAMVCRIAEGLTGVRPLTTPDVAALSRTICDAAIMVGNDSGPAHLAAALGTRAVVLMSATLPERCAPVGEHVTVIHEPCDLGGCYYRRNSECRGCIGRIEPSAVVETIGSYVGHWRR